MLVFDSQEHSGGGLVFDGQSVLAGAVNSITPNVIVQIAPFGATMLWLGATRYSGFVPLRVTPSATMVVTLGNTIIGDITLFVAIQAAMAHFSGHGLIGGTLLNLFPFGGSLVYDGTSFPRWPSTLPDQFLKDGLTFTPQDNRLRSEMDAGAPKQRRRFTAKIENVSGPLLMDDAQVSEFVTFYEDIVLDGTLPFRWVHPRTGAPMDMRFNGPYTLTSFDGINYFVNVTLEILP